MGRAGLLLLWGTEGSREQKIPNNRLREDINQISLEIIGHTKHTHALGFLGCAGTLAPKSPG